MSRPADRSGSAQTAPNRAAEPVRRVHESGIHVPPYVVSVTDRRLHRHRQRWQEERRQGRSRPEPEDWEPIPADDPECGVLALVDTEGRLGAVVVCDGVQGVLSVGQRLLAAEHGRITAWGSGLEGPEVFASHPCFNDLHSLRPGADGGVLVASTGVDEVVELAPDGAIRWGWPAMDHGYDHDSFGVPRTLDRVADHRTRRYDTWLHTTHLNSAVPYRHGVLITLFHQGALVFVDRGTGVATEIRTGLSRPHALRWHGELLTLADTARGKAIAGTMSGMTFQPTTTMYAATGWLQDCRLTGEYWVLVDGENSRVRFVNHDGTVLVTDQFDPRWLLYEVEPLPDGWAP